MQTDPTNPTADATAVGEIVKAFHVSTTVAATWLTALATVPAADLLVIADHGTQVTTAAAAAPGQWRNWWWVCVGGEVLFLPLILVMAGRWSPRRAREDAEEHERLVQQELAALRPASSAEQEA